MRNCIFPLDYSFSLYHYLEEKNWKQKMFPQTKRTILTVVAVFLLYEAVCCIFYDSLILLIYLEFCDWGFANLWKILLTVINTEAKNILLRHIYQNAREKVSFESFFWHMILIHHHMGPNWTAAYIHFSLQLKPKRAAAGNLLPEHGCKQPRVSTWQCSLTN